jgi:AmmeMemoRadiSam system protein B
MSEVQPAEIRPAQFADDQWYPSSASRLRQMLESQLQQATYHGLGRPLGLLAPHAGLRFSGPVAAHAYRQIEGQVYDYVAVISPLHRHRFGEYAVSRCRYYSTPLGLVELAGDLVEQIGAELLLTRVGRDDEHSLEIQLPFLQIQLGEFRLIPIMMGEQSLKAAEKLARALAGVLRGKSALVVASSDLSHFHSYDAAKELDQRVAEKVEKYDSAGLAEELATGRAEACGGGPILAAMLACQQLGASRAVVLRYENSGDVWVDRTSVVGYLAAAIYGPERPQPPEGPRPPEHPQAPDAMEYGGG